MKSQCKIVQRAIEQMETQERLLLKLTPVAEDVEKVINVLTSQHGEAIGTLSPMLYLGNTYVTIDHLANDALYITEVLKAFALMGYRQVYDMYEDTRNGKRFYYLGKVKGDEREQLIAYTVSFSSEGNCKYVQVGTRTVPVFELKCD